MMQYSTWTQADSSKTKRIWREFQEKHDLSHRIGQTAGIDPTSGRVWFGESILEIIAQRDKENLNSPLFFERVGSDAYFRKGTHQ